jgi:hypothetical protein
MQDPLWPEQTKMRCCHSQINVFERYPAGVSRNRRDGDSDKCVDGGVRGIRPKKAKTCSLPGQFG